MNINNGANSADACGLLTLPKEAGAPREKEFRIESKIKELEGTGFSMFRRDFLLSWEKGVEDILGALLLAEILEKLYRDNISLKVFETGLAVSLFRNSSTRTKMAFSSACDLLGLAHQEIDEQNSQVAHGETVRETANMISFLSEVIGIRDSLFLGRGKAYMREVAASVDGGFHEGVLNCRPAVINLQCDLDHPMQALSTLLHLKTYFGGIDRLWGKKIAVSWAYSPAPAASLAVPQGLIALMSRFGMDVVLACPEGYGLVPEVMEKAGRFAADSGGSFQVTHDMREAFNDADVVYPKNWAPYRLMKNRVELSAAGNREELENLEKEYFAENVRNMDWHCDEEMIGLTRDGRGLYMHCLPAAVGGAGREAGEVSHEVFERYRVGIYRKARRRAFIIAAIIILCRFRDPVTLVDRIYRRKNHRLG